MHIPPLRSFCPLIPPFAQRIPSPYTLFSRLVPTGGVRVRPLKALPYKFLEHTVYRLRMITGAPDWILSALLRKTAATGFLFPMPLPLTMMVLMTPLSR